MSPPEDPAGADAAPWPSRRVAAVALVVSGLGFALLAVLVTAGATGGFDRWLVRALRTSEALDDPLGPALLGEFFFDITHVGGRSTLGLFGILAAGFLIVIRDWQRVGFLVLALVGGAGLAGVFKGLFARVRPDIVPHLAQETSLSFPSGHATYSALACIVFCVLLFRAVRSPPGRAYIAVVAAFVVLLVGFSRVWLGVHYPSDVLAGWCLGTAWAFACWLAVDRLAR